MSAPNFSNVTNYNQQDDLIKRVCDVVFPPVVIPDDLAKRFNYGRVCRLCASEAEETHIIPLYRREGVKYDLPGKIRKYLSIKVSESEFMPQGACARCVGTLLSWHELSRSARIADFMLRRRLGVGLRKTRLPGPSESAGTEVTREGVRCDSPLLLTSIVKKVLTTYFYTLNIEGENVDFEYVCQKCHELSVGNSIEDLAGHLATHHESEIVCERSIHDFIKGNITFEESLTIDEAGGVDAESAPETNELPLPQFCCPHCKSIFSSTTRLLCHLSKHVDVGSHQGVACCNSTHGDRTSLVTHLREQHARRTVGGAVCRTCGFFADDDEGLHEHIEKSHVEATAPSPERIVRKTSNCQKYARVVCPKCKKMFSNKYNMLVHLKSHSAVSAKHTCEICNKNYKSRGSLTHHFRVVHEGEMRYLCAACGECFPSRTARDVHARLHSGHKPYSCDHCGKSYRAKNTLSKHLEMHFDVRKYACYLCPKKFRKSTHLKYHMTTHERKRK